MTQAISLLGSQNAGSSLGNLFKQLNPPHRLLIVLLHQYCTYYFHRLSAITSGVSQSNSQSVSLTDELTNWLKGTVSKRKKILNLISTSTLSTSWTPIVSTINQHFVFPYDLTLSSIRSFTPSFLSKQGWGKLRVTPTFCHDFFSSLLMSWTPSSTSLKLQEQQVSNRERCCFL